MKDCWQTGGYLVVKSSILLGLLAGWLTLRYFRFPLPLAIAIFLFVTLLVYDRVTAGGKRTGKTYPVSLDDARHIVLNVLNEKGMPYKESGGYIFTIEDEVEIRLLPSTERHRSGTAVSLTPLTSESDQLVLSLRQKLDDAFRPRGL